MRLAICVPLVVSYFAANVNAGSIEGLVSDAGQSSFQYNFVLTGFGLGEHQVLDLQFDPAVYRSLSDALVPPNFQVVILQPGNPPGAPGDYLLESMTAGPALALGAVGIDFTLTGQRQPGPLPFFIYQFDDQNQFVSVVASGMTTDGTDPPEIPEPSTFSLAGFGLLVAGILGSRWVPSLRRSSKVPSPILAIEPEPGS